MKYKTIYADPPWSETGGGQIHRGADRHYPLMKTTEILAMADFVKSISESNCHLYLWVTNNFMQDGFKVMERWGFDYKTIITWTKDRFGLGQYFRGMTEHCLFGVRGVLPYKTVDDKRQQGVTGFTAPRQEHSQKPEDMRIMIEKVSYPPYIELFARKEDIPGWDVWGQEVGSNGIETLPVIKHIETNRVDTGFAGDKRLVQDITPDSHENQPYNAESRQSFIDKILKNQAT